MKSIRSLISSAIMDGHEGGLRRLAWKSDSGDLSVVGVSRIKEKTYVNQSMKLNIRDCDRVDCITGLGGPSHEIFVKLTRIVSALEKVSMILLIILSCRWALFGFDISDVYVDLLQDQKADKNAVKEMVEEDLRLLSNKVQL